MANNVKFRRGDFSTFNGQSTYDVDAFSVVKKVKSSSDTAYSRLYIGNNMVGCGHTFTSGNSGLDGLVPHPTGTIGTTRYLREDGTWNVPGCRVVSTSTTKIYYPLIFKYSQNVTEESTSLRFSAKALGATTRYHLATSADGELLVRSLDTDANIIAGGSITAVENVSTTNGYFVGLLYPNATLADASILTFANQPLTTAANQTEDTKPVTAKNVAQYVANQLEWGTW